VQQAEEELRANLQNFLRIRVFITLLEQLFFKIGIYKTFLRILNIFSEIIKEKYTYKIGFLLFLEVS
jgi:hypothetical protein